MTTVPKMLVPIDFSSGSDSSVAYATALAQSLRSVVTLFHVYESSDAMSSILRTRTTTDRAVEMRVVVVSGSPAQEVISLARKSSYDMIVMGTHGRTGLQHVLMGSVAEAVVRRASCPVLTIHCPFRTATARVESGAVDSRLSR
jgi:nucleotide-binding universal stress UspA family protein